MRFSKFSRIYEICDSSNNFYYLIRHSLLNYSYLLTEKEFNKLLFNLKKNTQDNKIKSLINNHLVVPLNYSEEKFLEYIRQKNNFPFFSIFYLIFNTNCNLNCNYCYTEGSVENCFKNQMMNEKTLTETFMFLNKFINDGKIKHFIGKDISFIFYGSEPLMNLNLFELALNNINALSKKFKINIEKQLVTNAVLINDSTARLLKQEKVNVSVSLDGPEDLNNKARVFHDGSGTFKAIMKGINILKREKIPFSISCTIGGHNVNYLNKNINFFKKIGATNIGFNLLLDAKFKKVISPSNFISNENLLNSFNSAEKEGFFESRVGRKLKSFNSPGKIHFRDCGAYGNQLVFFPNGDIGVCQGYLGYRKHILGKVKSSILSKIVNSPILNKWILSTPINRKECTFCPALGICGGGCAFNSEINYGDISKRNKSFCIHTFLSLEWLIRESLKRKMKDKNIYIKDMSFLYN